MGKRRRQTSREAVYNNERLRLPRIVNCWAGNFAPYLLGLAMIDLRDG